MSWDKSDATRHNKAAKSDKAKKVWAKVANRVLDKSGNEGRAIREANAVVDRIKPSKRK